MTPKKKASAKLETRSTSFHHTRSTIFVSPYFTILSPNSHFSPEPRESQGRAKGELRKSQGRAKIEFVRSEKISSKKTERI